MLGCATRLFGFECAPRALRCLPVSSSSETDGGSVNPGATPPCRQQQQPFRLGTDLPTTSPDAAQAHPPAVVRSPRCPLVYGNNSSRRGIKSPVSQRPLEPTCKTADFPCKVERHYVYTNQSNIKFKYILSLDSEVGFSVLNLKYIHAPLAVFT